MNFILNFEGRNKNHGFLLFSVTEVQNFPLSGLIATVSPKNECLDNVYRQRFFKVKLHMYLYVPTRVTGRCRGWMVTVETTGLGHQNPVVIKKLTN